MGAPCRKAGGSLSACKPAPAPSVTSGSVPMGLWPVPQGTPYFTGRETFLAQMHASLASSTAVGVTQAVSGLGGVGKTSVAIAYARDFAEHYGYVFWLDAG